MRRRDEGAGHALCVPDACDAGRPLGESVSGLARPLCPASAAAQHMHGQINPP